MMIVISYYFPTAELKGDSFGGDTERATTGKNSIACTAAHQYTLVIGIFCRSLSIELYTTII